MVTIAIPTHNRANGYLRATLESALAQCYAPLEIIVSDNCSTDNTPDVVKSYGDPRVRYLRQERALRPNDNFNFCLHAARGEYFQLLHDDDLIDADFVECCMASLQRQGVEPGIIRTGAREIDGMGEVLSALNNAMEGLSIEDLCLSWLNNRTRMFLCATIFRAECLRKIGGFNSRHQLYQDVLAEFLVAASFGRLDVPAVKASFRKHTAQNTHVSRIGAWCEDSMLLLDALCAIAPKAAASIRRRGLRKFALHNYHIAYGIANPADRYRALFEIYRIFGYSYSPLRFTLRRTRDSLRARLAAAITASPKTG